MPARETVFYENDFPVLITDRRAVIGPRTFAVANISSVSVHTSRPDAALPNAAIWSGLLCGALSAVAIMASSGPGPAAWIAAPLSLLLLAGGLAWRLLMRPAYVLRIRAAGGETDALVSQDMAAIRRVAAALDEAIVHRG